MEAAILNSLPATTTSAKLYRIHRRNHLSLSCFPLTTPKTSGLRSPRVCCSSSTSFSSNTQEKPCQQLALLLEVEGVLMDIYRFGNRQAFNVAFQKLGLDCASWTQPVYQDLVKKSFGDEERMLILYFNRIGWPTSLPTNEKETFMKRVLREKKNALDDLVISQTLPLRPGVEAFIDEALEESIPVVMLTTYSKRGEKVARSIVKKLGNDRMSKIKIIGDEEVKQSFYGQLVLGKGASSDLGELLAKEVNKAVSAEEQRIAKEVASMLKLSVDIDTTSTEGLVHLFNFENIVAALRAGAEYAETPVDKCILVTASQSGINAAERIGMLRVVVRSSLTARAEFTGANSVMDGFGGADLTISKLRQIQKS